MCDSELHQNTKVLEGYVPSKLVKSNFFSFPKEIELLKANEKEKISKTA